MFTFAALGNGSAEELCLEYGMRDVNACGNEQATSENERKNEPKFDSVGNTWSYFSLGLGRQGIACTAKM